MMTIEEKQDATFETILGSLTAESEFFGIVGRGHSSMYKVYVRPTATSAIWWRIDTTYGRAKDPISAQARIPVEARCTVIWGPISQLARYAFGPGTSRFLYRLWGRAKEIETALAASEAKSS